MSISGFYEWLNRPTSSTAAHREELKALIRHSFDASDETYGYRRVHAELGRWGIVCSPELVRALMRELGLAPCQPRPVRFSLTEAADPGRIPDLVRRDFTAGTPGEKLVGDITYISTGEGWLYLATVIDFHTKAVIGWSMDDHYKTPLIEDAIHMATAKDTVKPGAIFHSDRSSNYTSRDFAATLRNLDLRKSAGRTGICYDNSQDESFSPHSKWSACTALNTLRVYTHGPTLRAISNFATISNDSTQGSATGHHAKPTTSSRTGSKQHEIAIQSCPENARRTSEIGLGRAKRGDWPH